MSSHDFLSYTLLSELHWRTCSTLCFRTFADRLEIEYPEPERIPVFREWVWIWHATTETASRLTTSMYRLQYIKRNRTSAKWQLLYTLSSQHFRQVSSIDRPLAQTNWMILIFVEGGMSMKRRVGPVMVHLMQMIYMIVEAGEENRELFIHFVIYSSSLTVWFMSVSEFCINFHLKQMYPTYTIFHCELFMSGSVRLFAWLVHSCARHLAGQFLTSGAIYRTL